MSSFTDERMEEASTIKSVSSKFQATVSFASKQNVEIFNTDCTFFTVGIPLCYLMELQLKNNGVFIPSAQQSLMS